MRVRLTQIDGKLPNLALMKLAFHHRARGDEVVFADKDIEPDMLEDRQAYDRVYGSAIFSFSANRVARFRTAWPGAIVGGTWNQADRTTVEDVLGIETGEAADYSIYPNFDGSIGFTQRGCRLKCGFCVVPKKEGKNHTVNTIADIWRGEGFPRHLHLLDNDFFGQPAEQWQARLLEIRRGGFMVCLNQGINVRMITDEAAAALASIPYRDDSFKYARLYTAWDNIGDEGRFFTGIDRLNAAGIPSTHIMAYMLIGYDKRETWERVLYRFGRMVERGVKPYPMVFGDRTRGLPLGGAHPGIAVRTLAEFQRYAIRRLQSVIPFQDYDTRGGRPVVEGQAQLDL